mmetsp:Transcript_86145/g.216807  ORF Transcript_86145/g.216807 Transcript_86145/m.216807 type:complete len:153 (+) Transcript_86145:66-524(+)
MAGSRTIQITSGVYVNTTRMWLKKELERFGEIDVCHMGNRERPEEEPPWVRFNSPKAAEDALAAIEKGEVFVDGAQLKAEWRSGVGRPAPSREKTTSRRDLDFSSRDLMMGGGGGGGRDRDRSRSRKRSRSRRRRRDSRSRSRDRDRDRRGR